MNFSGFFLRLMLAGCVLLLVLGCVSSCFASQELAPFRVGISHSIFSNVSLSDAKASIRTLGRILAAGNLPVDENAVILTGNEDLSLALHAPTVDAVAMTVVEYRQIGADGLLDPIYLPQYAETLAEQYVVLTRRDGQIKKLADLHGKTMAVYEDPTMCLAQPWLDTVLIKAGLPNFGRLVRITAQDSRLSKIVLPVFFRQIDACLVTRSGLQTMSELNPQVQEQLLVLDASPEVYTIVLGLRASYQPPFRERIVRGFDALKETPAGQQVLTIFKLRGLSRHPREALDSAFKLLEEYESLRP